MGGVCCYSHNGQFFWTKRRHFLTGRARKKRVKNMIQGGTMANIPSIQISNRLSFPTPRTKKLTDYFLANELLCSWGKLVFLEGLLETQNHNYYCWMYSVQVTRTFIPIFSSSSLPLLVIISPSVLTTIKVGKLLISYLYLNGL